MLYSVFRAPFSNSMEFENIREAIYYKMRGALKRAARMASWILGTVMTAGLSSAMLPCCPVEDLPAAFGGQHGAMSSDMGGVDYIFVVDTTGSMNQRLSNSTSTRWDELHPRLVENVRRLRPGSGDRLHLLVFGDRIPAGGLLWQEAGGQVIPIPTNRSAAFVFAPGNDLEMATMVRSIEQLSRPNGRYSALRDALRIGFERALFLEDGGEGRKIVLAVFSDGDDNASRTMAPELERLVTAATQSLGSRLVNEAYLFIRVAGLNIPPPTARHVRRVDHTPLFATVGLGADSLTTSSLAVDEITAPFAVRFNLEGIDGVALPIYFEPSAGGPRVRVLCGDHPAVWGRSGTYRVRLQRLGPASDYSQSFEGRLMVDTSGVKRPDLVLNNLTPEGTRVIVPGARSEPIPPGAVRPRAHQRFLVGSNVTFEAPYRDEARYQWRLRGAENAEVAGPSFVRGMATAGLVGVELRVEQDGVVVPPVAFDLEIIDPGARLTSDIARPVAGEPVTFTVSMGAPLLMQEVQWLPRPLETSGTSATYRFEDTGSATVTALVTTELGRVVATASAVVGPGVLPPELIEPTFQTDAQGRQWVQLHRTSEPQTLVATVGEGVAAVRFELTQDGQVAQSVTVDALSMGSERRATWSVAGAVLQPGPARLALEALPKDPSLLQRLGPRVATYEVLVNRAGVSLTRLEPTRSELDWGRPLNFLAVLEGPGFAQVRAVDWRVEVVGSDGSRVSLPGRSQPASDWLEATANRAVAHFEFLPEADNPRLSALQADAALEVVAEAQGDPAVVEGAQTAWSGLSPKFAPARFVIDIPRQVWLDERFTVRVRDELGGAIPMSVRWTMMGEDVDPLSGQSGSEQEVILRRAGAHSVRAEVTWVGGRQVCPEVSFYVDYEPVSLAALQWEGENTPVLVARNRATNDPVVVTGQLRGTRAQLAIDLRQVGADNTSVSLPGYPKIFGPEYLRDGIGLEFPPVEGRKANEYSVVVVASGLDVEGASTQLPPVAFRLMNRPPLPLSLIFAFLLILVLLASLILWATHANETRFTILAASSHTESIKTALDQLYRSGRPGKIAQAQLFQDLLRYMRETPQPLLRNVRADRYFTLKTYCHPGKEFDVPLTAFRAAYESSGPAGINDLAKLDPYLRITRKGGRAWLLSDLKFKKRGRRNSDYRISAVPSERSPLGRGTELLRLFRLEPSSMIAGQPLWLLVWDYRGDHEAKSWLRLRRWSGWGGVAALILLALVTWEIFV